MVMQQVLEDWDGQTAERRQKLDAAMRSRQFVTHAMPFSIEAELVEPEDSRVAICCRCCSRDTACHWLREQRLRMFLRNPPL